MSTIGTNVGALNASFFLSINNAELNNSIRRLASGSRLAVPNDDAAGVAVSANLDATIVRLQASADNATNAISFAQTTDGFLKTIQEQLTRMSELAQRALNGAFGSSDLSNYNTEFTVLRTQIGSILNNARFNNSTIFQASGADATITVGINASAATDTFVKSSFTNLTSFGIAATTIGTTTAASAAVGVLTTALSSLTTQRARVNADISKFQFHIQNIRTEKINVEAANSRIRDLDVAEESTNLSKQNILLQASTSMLAQANVAQQAVLSLLR